MKIPCEIVVWYVLPTIRREIASVLVETYKMPQSQIAKKFGVTDAAVSQYMKKKRGESPVIKENDNYLRFKQEIDLSAAKIANDTANFAEEICRICTVARELGILAKVYESYTGQKFPSVACPKQSSDKPQVPM